MILLVLLTSVINTLSAKNYSYTTFNSRNGVAEKTTLKVALYPYLPDSAGDNLTNLSRFIEEEFMKVQSDINLQLRSLTQNENFYSLAILTPWLSSNGSG